MSFDSLMTTSFDVQRVTNTADAVGGSTETWADLSTGNSGRYRLLKANERESQGKERVISTHRWYCRDTVTVDEADRIVGDSKTFEVNYVHDVDAMAHHKQIDCTLIEG